MKKIDWFNIFIWILRGLAVIGVLYVILFIPLEETRIGFWSKEMSGMMDFCLFVMIIETRYQLLRIKKV